MKCPVCNSPRIYYWGGTRRNGAPYVGFRCGNAGHMLGFINGPQDENYPLTKGIWELILNDWPLDSTFNPAVKCPHPGCGGELRGRRREWFNARKGKMLAGYHVYCENNQAHFVFFINQKGWRPPV